MLQPRRSACPSCQHQIAGYDNIPVLSWLILRGRCRNCKAPISPRYLLVEMLTALLFLGCAWRFGATLATVKYCVLAFLLLGSIPGVLLASRAAIRLPAALTNTLIAIMLGVVSQRMLLAK